MVYIRILQSYALLAGLEML